MNKIFFIYSIIFTTVFIGGGAFFVFFKYLSVYYIHVIVFLVIWLIFIYSATRCKIFSFFNTKLSNTTFLVMQQSSYINHLIMLIVIFVSIDVFIEFLAWLNVGIPLLSENPEITRVKVLEILGAWYRIAVASKFIALSLLGFLYHFKKKLSFMCISIIFIIQFLSGFRSGIVDGFLLLYMSYYSTISTENNNKISFTFNWKLLLIVFLVLSFLVYLTAIRYELNLLQLGIVFKYLFNRIFLENINLNIPRIYDYVKFNGFFYGKSYITDIISIFKPDVFSFQQTITYFSNPFGNNMFVMTPTFYGESFANFGLFYFIGVFIWFFIFKILLIYNYLINKLFFSVLSYAMFINTCYWMTRQVTTGGLMNALLIKLLPIIVLGTFISFLLKFLGKITKEVKNERFYNITRKNRY